MEEELGVSLFERLPQGVRLTSAGELFLQMSRMHLADLDRVKSQIADLKGTVVLELGGGRQELGDDIDSAVGFILEGHVGSLMVVDEPWITVYHRGELSAAHQQLIQEAIILSNEPVDANSRIIDIL